VDALLNALNLGIRVHQHTTQSILQTPGSKAIAYLELAADFFQTNHYGVGRHTDAATAEILAILSGLNRALRRVDAEAQAALLRQDCVKAKVAP
ncbi:MAG: 2-isopropylmalate synthase, partial [Cyanobacteria bacterium P01_H01_bin.119]